MTNAAQGRDTVSDAYRPAPALLVRSDVEAAGFTGFIPFAALPTSDVPSGPGVYVILRDALSVPQFRTENPGGRHKGKDPTVPVEMLRSEWVTDVHVVYIGKATRPTAHSRQGLRSRLAQYRRFGAGAPAGHWGGRYVWQLADAHLLVVAWKQTPHEDAGSLESALLSAFKDATGSLPFANLRH